MYSEKQLLAEASKYFTDFEEDVQLAESGEFPIETANNAITLGDILAFAEQNNIELTEAASLRRSGGRLRRPVRYVLLKVWDDGQFDEYELDRRLVGRGKSETITKWKVLESKLEDSFDYYKRFTPDGFHINLRVCYDKPAYSTENFDSYDSLDERYGGDWDISHNNLIKLAKMQKDLRIVNY